jgi:hypothetical protein
MIFTFLLLGSVCLLVYGLLWFSDFSGMMASSPFQMVINPRNVQVLAGLAEVTVAVLGVALTVVAIIVELAAHRYTSQITELFVTDPINGIVMGFFSLTAVVVFWILMSLAGDPYPETMAMAAVGLMSVSLLILLPYFVYVFHFISPTGVVLRIQDRGVAALRRVSRNPHKLTMALARNQVRSQIDQLGGMTVNCIGKKDKAIAVSAMRALSVVAEEAMLRREKIPESWFKVDDLLQKDHDFVAFQPMMSEALETHRVWVEMKVMRQYQVAFNAALPELPDINHLVAIHIRNIASFAIAQKDSQSLDLAMRFLNTFLRTAINARHVRSAYNILNEYRELGQIVLKSEYSHLVVDICRYVKFYSLLSHANHLPFVLETAAYDLCALLEQTLEPEPKIHDTMLELFLELDREPDGEGEQEISLRGVRKAQVKLATFYLMKDRRDMARRVFADMREESFERIQSIRSELTSIDDPEYWEVTDRGINFDYLVPERRATLEEFFSWFEET